ncbi:MAG: hypothetical protein K0U98_10880 [Deltaproteobacteria bacterium]|nr:hypothetical protein [Deltaproteobacteria bacterium]
MNKLEPTTIRKRRWGALALLITLGFGVAFTTSARRSIPVFDSSGGPWRNVSPFASCPGDTLCAEWPQASTNVAITCCIDEDDIGTSDPESCQLFLSIRPLGNDQ